jgi:8-oxo-dGTP pyrophosphatase MutT (NUDIX family)
MPRPAWLQFRTARCILWSGERVLLAVHHNYLPHKRGRWGLPGGRIEMGETAEEAARREVTEELGLTLGELIDCGDYRYKGSRHKVFGTRFDGNVDAFDRNEIAAIGWHSIDEIEAFQRGHRLHAGYEHDAVRAFLDLLITADRRAP